MASLRISAPALPARAVRAGGAARTRRAQPVAMATKRIGKKDEPAPIGTADEPLLPGFGKQDNKVARANRDPSKYLSTQVRATPCAMPLARRHVLLTAIERLSFAVVRQ